MKTLLLQIIKSKIKKYDNNIANSFALFLKGQQNEHF